MAATMIANGILNLLTVNIDDFKSFKEIKLIKIRY